MGGTFRNRQSYSTTSLNLINKFDMFMTSDLFAGAIKAFDLANSADPNQVEWNSKNWPKELLYSQRMSEMLMSFEPEASEPLKLAARCQHICRWTVPRDDFPMDRKGYHTWRNKLKTFHANKASKILGQLGYDEKTIEEVSLLLNKKKLKTNPDSQALEDVACLVFLRYYLNDFALEQEEAKVIDILRKTWNKMSNRGQELALQQSLSSNVNRLLSIALAKH